MASNFQEPLSSYTTYTDFNRPDDHYLGSMIASTIDGFVESQGIQEFIAGDWNIVMTNNYVIGLTTTLLGNTEKAIVRLNDLEEMTEYISVKSDDNLRCTPLDYMITDRLAMAVLLRIKEQEL
jgi:hypothetical protein